jgi:hypothetical protein
LEQKLRQTKSAKRMRSNERLIQALAVFLLVTGCAGPTPYHPSLEGTGYTDYKISDDRYQVSYTANSLTNRSKVGQYLIYRAAQIALESNRETFVVLGQEAQDFSLPDYARGSDTYRHHYFEHHHLWFGDDRASTEELSTPTLEPLARYTASITIVLYSEAVPPVEGKTYNAREVIEVLGNAIVRP